jgi:single-stranded-DNA-specific exonuclease
MKKYRVRGRTHDELIPDLLASRGIVDTEAANFLAPDFERDSHDPFLLPDMGVAVERILVAVKNSERVAVWSDYDCDGIPGGVMLVHFFTRLGLPVRHYIPHRHEEGYGLNIEGIDELANEGTTLIVTVDLGTTDHKPIAHAKSRGIDVIVTDHHLVHGQLPLAVAVVNPKRPGSRYPFDALCGAGVAWKLVQGILARNRFGLPEGHEKWYLDLAGLGTLTDMVPLRGENRVLARFGLTVMRRARRPGFAALLSLLRIKPNTLTEDDIGFMVAPRINAASRMDSPEVAARLLATEDREEAAVLAKSLQALNDERKGVVAATVKEIKRRIGESEALSRGMVVMGSPNWRPGILGLAANSIAESTGAPVCLWGREGGELLRGSCRSGGNTNVVELMRGASDLFEDFGGHAFSGGFAIKEERVHELAPRLAQSFERLQQQQVAAVEGTLEREVDLSEVSRAQRSLERLSPFGTGFEKPLFLFPQVELSSMRTFGKTGDHLEFGLARNGTRVSGISFFSTPDSFDKKISQGMRADVVGHVERDWRGGPRIRVVDIL